MKIRTGSWVLAGSLLINLLLWAEMAHLNRQLAEVAQRVPAPDASQTAPPPFRWAQLESTDYPTYIANLRGIGCPEQTVREIIAADLDDLYAPQRQSLQARVARNGGASPERDQLEGELAQLRQGEASEFRRLFGIADPVAATTPPDQNPAPVSRVRNNRRMVEDTTVAMPLVFQPVNTNVFKLSAEDAQTITELQQSFLAEMGTNLDPNSPEYLHRWQKAQKESDSLMDGLLGRQFRLSYEEAIEMQTAQNGTQPSGNQQ